MNNDKKNNKFTIKMQKKLVVLFVLILLAFVGLAFRLYSITKENGEQYKKQVLSQQRYDSTPIPFKRGSILDSHGSLLAVSEKVYNVILDSVAISEKEEYLQPTLDALSKQLGIDVSNTRSYIEANKQTSRYYPLKKRMSFEEIQPFKELQEKEGSLIKGVWFEEEYKRSYPGNTLACDVLGFTTSDNVGSYGLEEYYNDVLSGTAGREYGYLNGDADLERTTIPAKDGNSLVTTIDANIQSIVEKYLTKFNEEYKDKTHEGNGAENVGCIIMDVHSGEILAMASYPFYNLNDTRNTDAMLGMPAVNAEGKKILPTEYLNAEKIEALKEDPDTLYQNLNFLWKNFCINDTYEPGSVAKPFTVAAGIESGSITGNEQYNCQGKLHIGDYDIRCHNRFGDGTISVAQGIERSCNVCMMYVAQAMGKDNFAKFQHIFNLGLKTNIDLAGEGRTAGLLYTKDTLGPTELATNSFGQSFNVTMIQMITGFCSLINGGYYYEPHMVKKIVSSTGATVQNIEPRILKQTISESTSATIRDFCNLVVTGEKGTGKTARPPGYMIGGKTGTAETLPRKNREYVVSFMGYAPADDPEIAIYVVVDRPNVALQDDAKYATFIVRDILMEVLPYMGIFMTEELSDEERTALEALQIEIMTPPASELPDASEESPEGTDAESPDQTAAQGTEGETSDEDKKQEEIWKTFPIDPATGYAIDPDTGDYIDPVTGVTIGGSYEGEYGAAQATPSADGNDKAASDNKGTADKSEAEKNKTENTN